MWEILTRQMPHEHVITDPRVLKDAELDIPSDAPPLYKALMTVIDDL